MWKWIIAYLLASALAAAFIGWLGHRAPEGWEDEDGWHEGRKP